ncbi:MAG: B12-binding domain-containing radical SAM protein [Deltaproteobacteria bacterium]|nr:B12-binding domain-containing radical SAM protein [Deltaproteobacteria bacterium]
MHVKMILPALTEACSPYYRPLKYSLFPPLGLAALAGYLPPDDRIEIQDEHVERLRLDDRPDLVVIECYISSAYRSYQLADHYRARGAHVCIGGLHPSSLPEEAAQHADTVFQGPGEDTWPRFLSDFRRGAPGRSYLSTQRSLEGAPAPRRDLIHQSKYLVPNSLVVSRGCPHACDFCYKEPFFRGGRSFYTQRVDAALEQIASLPGRHLFFLDDNLFADRRFAAALFEGMQGMGRLWQAAGTVRAALDRELLDRAVDCGLRSLFVGFETINAASLAEQNKRHNRPADYEQAAANLHARGVMINASLVYGMDHDDPSCFERTVDWAVERGLETATFHILTPYPGTALYRRLAEQGRILTRNWDRYDTRHCVFQPAQMSPAELEAGYWESYERFYRWGSIVRAARSKPGLVGTLRHLAYAGGWKKCELLWRPIIRAGLISRMRALLEAILGAGVAEPGCRTERADPTDAHRQLAA